MVSSSQIGIWLILQGKQRLVSLAIYPSIKPFIWATICYHNSCPSQINKYPTIIYNILLLKSCCSLWNILVKWKRIFNVYDWWNILSTFESPHEIDTSKKFLFTFWNSMKRYEDICQLKVQTLRYPRWILIWKLYKLKLFLEFYYYPEVIFACIASSQHWVYLISPLCYFQFSLFKLNFPATQVI